MVVLMMTMVKCFNYAIALNSGHKSLLYQKCTWAIFINIIIMLNSC